MNLYIPMRGRVDRQMTWGELPKELRERAWIVCPQEELEQHRAAGRRAIASPVEGIAPKLQWIADKARAANQSRICIVHDDVRRFHQRYKVTEAPLKIIKGQDILRCFARMERFLVDYPMVGLAQRQEQDKFLGRQSSPRTQERDHAGVSFNQRICTVYALDLTVLYKENIRFDAVTLMEDFHLNLSLLERGYSTALLTEYSYQQSTGSSGGCSLYRTPEIQKQASIHLAALHKPFVKVVEKRTRASWEGLNTRWDVNCYWTAAAKSGRSSKGGRLC